MDIFEIGCVCDGFKVRALQGRALFVPCDCEQCGAPSTVEHWIPEVGQVLCGECIEEWLESLPIDEDEEE